MFRVPIPFERQLNCLRAAQELFRECYAGVDPLVETLWVAQLDSARRCIHLSRHDGCARSVDFPLKSIVRNAIENDSAGILLAHNHPSGDPTPSEADLMVTRRLCVVSEALNCAVLDHFIFAGQDCTSLRSLGLL